MGVPFKACRIFKRLSWPWAHSITFCSTAAVYLMLTAPFPLTATWYTASLHGGCLRCSFMCLWVISPPFFSLFPYKYFSILNLWVIFFFPLHWYWGTVFQCVSISIFFPPPPNIWLNWTRIYSSLNSLYTRSSPDSVRTVGNYRPFSFWANGSSTADRDIILQRSLFGAFLVCCLKDRLINRKATAKDLHL